VRTEFESQLEGLEAKMLQMGQRVQAQLGRAIDAISRADAELAADVARRDAEIDRDYAEVEEEIVRTLALQAPVARDLRLVVAVVLINHHLERMGDLCVNIAKFAQHVHGVAGDPRIGRILTEMGEHARGLIVSAMASFAARDLEQAETLPILDEPLDRLNRQMFREIERVTAAGDATEGASEMILVARYLERLGDQSVDIGEQVGFIVTGQIRQFVPGKAARGMD
jgi:phosphate transport system protein